MIKKQRGSAYVLGVGLTKFVKPRGLVDYTELGFEAGIKALLDAHITYDDVEMGVASYCYGDSVSGQRVFYQFGMTEIPILNVNNNCASGSTGISMARDTISHGGADCILVVGFEKMKPGSLDRNFTDREDPVGRFMDMNYRSWGTGKASGAVQLFANAAQEYMNKYDPSPSLSSSDGSQTHVHSQERRQAGGLCRDSPGQPRAFNEEPVRPIPERVLSRSDPDGPNDPRTPDHDAVLSDQ